MSVVKIVRCSRNILLLCNSHQTSAIKRNNGVGFLQFLSLNIFLLCIETSKVQGNQTKKT